jgi:two-component system invasion response regulator UvrY
MKRLLVAHQFPVVRYGLIKLIEEHVECAVAAEADTVSQALQRVREAEWDVVVIGFSFGGQGGLKLLKAISEIRPSARLIVFSRHSEEVYARQSLKAGAAGYLTKDSSRAEVVHAIQAVLSGERYVRPQLAERRARPHRALSDREYEVMRLLASGRTVGDIASLLSLSERRVSTYRAHLLQKL